MGRIGSAATGAEARCASAVSRTTSRAVCPAMMRAPPSSKRAAVMTPLTRVCPSFISVFKVDGLVVAIEFERRGPLLLGAEAGVLRAAEWKLVFHARAGQVHGQQARFGPVDVFERAREIGGLNRRG